MQDEHGDTRLARYDRQTGCQLHVRMYACTNHAQSAYDLVHSLCLLMCVCACMRAMCIDMHVCCVCGCIYNKGSKFTAP